MVSNYNIHGFDNNVNHKVLDYNSFSDPKKKENVNKKHYLYGNVFFNFKVSYVVDNDNPLTNNNLNNNFENFFEKGYENYYLNCFIHQKGINVIYYNIVDNIYHFNNVFYSSDFNNNNIH